MMLRKRNLAILLLSILISSCGAVAPLRHTSASLWKDLPSGAPPATYVGLSCTEQQCIAVGQEATEPDGSSIPLIVAISMTSSTVKRVTTSLISRHDTISGVSCGSSGACWLVGNESTANGSNTLILSYRNGMLRRVASPNAPAPFNQNDLTSIDCPTPAICWAVGQSTDSLNTGIVLIERLGGNTWKRVLAPATDTTGAAELASVGCTSTTSCLGVGSASSGATNHEPRALVEELTGNAWHIVPLPRSSAITSLSGVSCPQPQFCRAVGTRTSADGSLLPYLITEAAGKWSAGLLSFVDPVSLSSVSCPDVTVCYVVGTTSPANAPGNFFAARWTATGWTTIALPQQTGTSLEAISCGTPSLCHAVGNSQVSGVGLVLSST